MDYISTKEAAAQWQVHIRVVQALCKAGRVPGAKKYGGGWLVPAGAAKPADPRTAGGALQFFTQVPLQKGGAEILPGSLAAHLQPLAAADIAYRRGDAAPAKAVWRATPANAEEKLTSASLAMAAAISSGDTALYHELTRFLNTRIATAKTAADKALLSLPQTMAAVSMTVPAMTPQWLQNCDFSAFPQALHPFLLYLYAMHLRNVKQYSAMLAVARTTLLLGQKEDTFTWLDVYLGVLCAVASYALGDAAGGEMYLKNALALGMPAGFIAPFADYLGDFGGALQALLHRQYPQQVKPVTALWEKSFKNWLQFHNTFAKENIATLLSLQEYQVAHIIAGGAGYAAAARQMHLSVGRIKNIISGVYAALCISSRQELKKFML